MDIKRKHPVHVATVYCNGGCDNKECTYGCIGCGACVSACKINAIAINEKGIAEVNEDLCIGCGLCAQQCPKNLIRIRLLDNAFAPLCSNKDKGPAVKSACDHSCIACGICVKKCPADAITLVENRSVIDDDLCLSCGICATVCPRGVIKDRRGVITPIH